MKTISYLLCLTFISFYFISNSQTCTSSGGDDRDFLDEPYRFRCGTSMMKHRFKKQSSDYKLIKTCSKYYADGNYYSNKGKIYFSPSYGEHELIASADAKSFRCENGTTRDNKHIFFLGKIVKDVDTESFKSIGSLYCGDDKAVYYRNKYAEDGLLAKIDGADIASFENVGKEHSSYAKDVRAVYLSGKTLAGSDPATFELLEYGYAKDKNQVYYNGALVEGMNANEFKVLKDCYLGSDGVQLCNAGKVLENSDAKSFKAIECGYYKDANNVYLNGYILTGVDSETFEILSWGYTKDKNAVYCDLKVITGAKSDNFEVLGRKYSKDASSIFYLHNKVKCDYKTFALDYSKDYLAKDKKGKISRGIRE